jgi:hypothetical protein
MLKPTVKHMPNLITNFDMRLKMFYEIGFVPICVCYHELNGILHIPGVSVLEDTSQGTVY